MRQAMITVNALLLTLLAGCTTLTPQQAAGLKEAQLFADKVTDGYAVGRVKVVVGTDSGYDSTTHWIHIAPHYLGGGDQDVLLALFLGPATLRLRQADTPRDEIAVRRQGISVMVRFLGMTEREAVDRVAALLVAHNEYLREDARRRGLKDWRVAFRPSTRL